MAEFWKNNGDKVLVGVVTAIFVLILSEPIKALFKKIGNQIEKLFQSLGFGFQKRYFHALNEGHKWLKLIGIYNPADLQSPRLQEVYISLRLNTAKESPTLVWDHVFDDKEKHMVILGQPGAGKSTLLDYLTLVFTGHIKHPLRPKIGNPLPIFVRLRDLGKSDSKQTLLSLIESAETIDLKNIPSGYFERHLKRGNCIVLFDGLDEVLDEASHKHAVKEIRAFANEYSENWIVVTCRVAGWQGQLPNFKQYTVREFDRDDVRQFIGAWYREVTRTAEINRLGVSPKAEVVREAEAKAYRTSLHQSELLWNALLKNESLLRIARTPLILSLVTLVHKTREKDLPRGRERLYRECLDILLDIWDSKDKGLPQPEGAPSPKDKLHILKNIAFHFLVNDILEMDKDGLTELVNPLRSSLTKPIDASSLIQQIYERSGVLVEQAIGKYGFAHRALHDYLATSYISEQGLDTLLIDHASEERWREVILIAIGLVSPKERANVLLESLLRQSDANPASLAVAGWSLAEDIQVRDDLRASVKTKILAKLATVENAAEFSLLSDALFDTDTVTFQNWINDVLVGNNADLRMRVMNEILPELGAEKSASFVPTLIRILGDSHADAGTRSYAAATLGRINPSTDSEIWKALESARQEQDHPLKASATWAWCQLGRFEELGLVKVDAGDFLMGSANEDRYADDSEKPQHTVYLSTFYIGKFPVTVAQYRAFIQESKHKTSHGTSLQGVDSHPVVNVSWEDSMKFSQWRGMTLPTEAQWEKAARGTDARIYPWGNDWRDSAANTDEYWNKGARGLWSKLRRRETRTTTPVGYFSPRGDSPYQCADMIGNVWEWCNDWYDGDEYQNRVGGSIKDPQGPQDGRLRVLRGGSFDDSHRVARCALRLRYLPNGFLWDRGFRVCVSPIISL